MTTIDFEQYRKPFELDDYWLLKKEFLQKYQNEFELDRLLALGQIFINIEVLGNTYDESIMALICRLTEGWESLSQFREDKRLVKAQKKKDMVKSEQVENERKRMKTDTNGPRGPKNFNNKGAPFHRGTYTQFNNANVNDGNKRGPYAFGAPNVYPNTREPPVENPIKRRRV